MVLLRIFLIILSSVVQTTILFLDSTSSKPQELGTTDYPYKRLSKIFEEMPINEEKIFIIILNDYVENFTNKLFVYIQIEIFGYEQYALKIFVENLNFIIDGGSLQLKYLTIVSSKNNIEIDVLNNGSLVLQVSIKLIFSIYQ